jgi:hypothetical protein
MLLAPLLLLLSIEPESLASWRNVATVSIAADLHHVQGIDVEGDIVWVSSVDAKAEKGYLSRLDGKTGRLLAQVELQQGRRLHPGGIALAGNSLWVPVAEYDRDGPTNIERRDKRTLKLISRFEVNDHIGCIASTGQTLIGGSWSSRTLYEWTPAGVELRKLPNPQPTAWQDLKFVNGLLIGSGPLNRQQGAIEWLSLTSFTLTRRILTPLTDRGLSYSHEGMTYRGGRLYLLPEDAPSRLFVFAP